MSVPPYCGAYPSAGAERNSAAAAAIPRHIVARDGLTAIHLLFVI
jgi:hypothetical protein